MHFRLKRKPIILASSAVVALIVATSASAANVVPNPGFEADCGGVPCSWTGIAGTTTRDTVNPHSGSASLKLAMPSTSPNQATAQTACFNASATGSVPVSYWYRASAEISGVAMTVGAYAAVGCSSLIVQSGIQPGVLDTTNTWQLVSTSIALGGSTAQSFKLTVAGGCTAACSSSKTVNFDDLTVGQAPTAVTLVSFGGRRTTHGVRLAWKTAAASRVAGFNLYRGQTKLNRTLISSKPGLAAAYSWLDRAVGRNARNTTYRLQAVNLDGTRAWLGTATLS